MNDQQRMVSDMVDGLFASLGPTATIDTHWGDMEQLGLPSLLLPEASGGYGGTWEDAMIVFRLAGYHALALPIAEAAIAARLAAGTDLQGRGTIADQSIGTTSGDRYTGSVHGAVMSQGAGYIAAPKPGGETMLLSTTNCRNETHANLAGEGRDIWHFTDARFVHVKQDVFGLGAFARVCQIAGALDAALALSVSYSNDRQQFGRPLAKFQAVQQSLASFACEAAATNCAAMGAAQALAHGDAEFEIGAAKLRANRAIGIGTSAAHQAHGAIGFTQDYRLHHLTRRLWSARSEFGGDSLWSQALGERVARAGADMFWPNLTALAG